LEAAERDAGRTVQRSSDTAVASLICGILGWSVLPIVGGILAIILGYTAKDEIRRSEGALGGDGLAALGLALGYANVGIAALSVVVVLLLAVLGIAASVGLSFCGICAAFGA
jgi:hypothetical protein